MKRVDFLPLVGLMNEIRIHYSQSDYESTTLSFRESELPTCVIFDKDHSPIDKKYVTQVEEDRDQEVVCSKIQGVERA